MPYIPPPPGSTVLGEPTPDGVKKQDAHIADLPPEVRRSFLLSMVFFPSIVGATVCLILFLGYFAVFTPRTPKQYADELRSNDARRRWVAARELSENIGKDSIYEPKTLTVLIEILQNPELDKESAAWSPSAALKSAEEKESNLRWWAARMVGHFAAVLGQKDPADRDRGLQALLKALDDKDVAVFAAAGLSVMYDARAREPLMAKLASSDDIGLREAAAHALGSIGYFVMVNGHGSEADVDQYRMPLRAAFISAQDPDLLDNIAVALARLQDPAGKQRLQNLEKSDDPAKRERAREALQILEAAKPTL